MERKQLIAGGAVAVAIVIALVVFMMIRSDGNDTTTPVADVSIAASDSPSPSTATTTKAPSVTTSAAPTTTAPTTATTPDTSAPPVTSAAPTKPSTGKVFARPPATVQTRANNTYTFYVEQITPLDSAVDVHLTNGETALTLHCPAPVAPGNCQVSWTTGSHKLTLNYNVTIDPVDPSYQTYTSRPLQFTTG